MSGWKPFSPTYKPPFKWWQFVEIYRYKKYIESLQPLGKYKREGKTIHFRIGGYDD